MRARLLGLTLLLLAGCADTRKCRQSTVWLDITYAGLALQAASITVTTTYSGAAAQSTSPPLSHTPGVAHGSVEIEFPHGYPKGAQLSAIVQAYARSTGLPGGPSLPVAITSGTVLLADACEALSVILGAPNGGGPGLVPTPPVLEFGPGGQLPLNIANSSSSQNTGVLTTSLVGGNASEFAISNDGCSGQTLTPGGSCSLEITFTSTAAATGTQSASLLVSATPGGSNLLVPLTGTVQPSGPVTLAPSAYDFMVFDVGLPQVPQQMFTLSTTDSTPTGVLAASLGGANAADFLVTPVLDDSCSGTIVSAGRPCSVRVSFHPLSFGAKSASLTITGTPFTSLTAGLSGTARDKVTLTVVKAGAGGGTVTAPATGDIGGAGINCGTTCSDSFYRTTANPMVTLTATPNSNSTISGWSVSGCSGNTCTVPVSGPASAPTTVTATFTPTQFTLTVVDRNLAGASGTVTGSGGINCGSTCMATLAANSTASVNTADASFQVFKIDCPGPNCTISTTQTTTIAMTANHVVQAVFKPNVNYMFLTNGTYAPGSLGGLSGADAICKSEAMRGGLAVGPSNWVAYLGWSMGTANSRLGTARGWIRPDGLAFADTAASLIDTTNGSHVFYPPRIDSQGLDAFVPLPPSGAGIYVATATKQDGSVDTKTNTTCGDYTMTGVDMGYLGDILVGDADWGPTWLQNYWSAGCSLPMRLYCFETDYMTPVAPPAIPAGGRLAFVSQTTTLGTAGVDSMSHAISDLDSRCASDAVLAMLSGTFLAFVATVGGPMADPNRFDFSKGPWYRPDGVQLVTNATDYQNAVTPLASICVSADGSTYHTGSASAHDYVFTGTPGYPQLMKSNGATNSTCANWTINSSSQSVGVGTTINAGDLSTGWGSTTEYCTWSAGVLCLQK